jgi:DNA replication protein DnaC
MIPIRYQNANWNEVPKQIRQAIINVYTTNGGLYIHGDVGTGKTYICWALYNYMNRRQQDCPVIYNVVDLINEIRQEFGRETYDKRYPDQDLVDIEIPRVAILDDLGAEKKSDFVTETLYRIINQRYIHHMPTIFTSNHTLDQLADHIGERSASRIVEMCEIIELTGGDRRLNM